MAGQATKSEAAIMAAGAATPKSPDFKLQSPARDTGEV
jgi:hypothetical protein